MLWSDRFFFVESGGEGPRLKFEREDSQTDSEKMALASVCDVSGATLQSCTVTRAFWNALIWSTVVGSNPYAWLSFLRVILCASLSAPLFRNKGNLNRHIGQVARKNYRALHYFQYQIAEDSRDPKWWRKTPLVESLCQTTVSSNWASL